MLVANHANKIPDCHRRIIAPREQINLSPFTLFAMCHFELTVREMGLSGEWVLSEQSIEKPDELTEYIVTWQQTEIS